VLKVTSKYFWQHFASQYRVINDSRGHLESDLLLKNLLTGL
jgi:hypothetical protein